LTRTWRNFWSSGVKRDTFCNTVIENIVPRYFNDMTYVEIFTFQIFLCSHLSKFLMHKIFSQYQFHWLVFKINAYFLPTIAKVDNCCVICLQWKKSTERRLPILSFITLLTYKYYSRLEKLPSTRLVKEAFDVDRGLYLEGKKSWSSFLYKSTT
jgi:hypothetical protein